MDRRRRFRNTTRSDKCGLIFPVARIKAILKVAHSFKRVSDTAAVFITAVLEYLVAEILEMSLCKARECSSWRIQPRHLNVAVKSDCELLPHFRTSTIPNGGCLALLLASQLKKDNNLHEVMKHEVHVSNKSEVSNGSAYRNRPGKKRRSGRSSRSKSRKRIQ
ncbi:histone H2A, embryonic-like [Stegodyphus dumicola]|uniref:histone H2A, embryonic-like n=1 Tax=Stegodyphus dumicola TaxID=202533 RepID=UPI0015B155A2|nr:histone H2A, embryonic-like [Stegodyphus dumicola]